MANQVVDNKFTWVIKNFSSLTTDFICSDIFVIGGCKWRLFAYPKRRFCPDYLSMYLQVENDVSLPPGWRRHARFNITIVNQNQEKNFIPTETKERWFDQNTTDSCFTQASLHRSKLIAKNSGFLVNDELKIVAEIEVLEVVGRLDVSEEAEAAIRPLKKTKLNVDGAVSSDFLKETIDVHGFQVLPSQVDSVRRIFYKHPDIVSGFRLKNPLMKAVCMNTLLSLTAILCQLPREISKDDLAYAYSLLRSMKEAGFKVDWLEKKLNELSEKKEKEKACKMRMQAIQKEWRELKAKVLAAKAPLTLDDVV